MLLIHTLRNGKNLSRWLVILLVAMLILSACSEGRGDWAIELHSGYWIDRVNSQEILLVYKESPNQSNSALVIPNYYITGYWLSDSYIILEGIQTEKLAASPKEISNKKLSYCIVFVGSGSVSPFYDSKITFAEYCYSLGIDISSDWIFLE